MLTDELDYYLPEELIAQHPADRRDEARLMVVHRDGGDVALDTFRNMPNYLRPGDCLIMNDTKVIRARLHGTKPTGGRVEIFLLRELAAGEWEALVRPSAKVKPSTAVTLRSGITVLVEERIDERTRRVVFDQPDVIPLLEQAGEVPLPPYIKREQPEDSDLTRYQTVYADKPGAVAAPTAGLHYTEDVFAALRDRGVAWTHITLHVGYGTFQPIATDKVEDHQLEDEEFELTQATAETIDAARASGGRIIAVGTTSTRVLETQYRQGTIQPGRGTSGTYIYPGYQFNAVDALQTNFHLPRSSLLALVYAFAGKDLTRKAYDLAIAERFRFYSYGDTMLIV